MTITNRQELVEGVPSSALFNVFLLCKNKHTSMLPWTAKKVLKLTFILCHQIIIWDIKS